MAIEMTLSDENNTRFLSLPGYGEDYGSQEARLAWAIFDTGGGTSTPPSAIKQGIDDSTDIDNILTTLQDINDKLDNPKGDYFEMVGNVGAAAVELEPALATRSAVHIQNTSSSNIYIRFGNTATYTSGFRIKPDGLFYSQIKQQVTQSISIISEVANSPYVGFVIQ